MRVRTLLLLLALAVRLRAADDFKLEGHEQVITQVCFSPDGKFLASGAQDKTARVWNLADKSAKKFVNEGRGTAFSVDISKDGKWLAVGDFMLHVKLYSLPAGDEAASLEGDTKQGYIAQHVAFSPKSDLLVGGFSSGEIRVWDVASKTAVKPFAKQDQSIEALAFSPDGKWLATAAWGALTIWDVAARSARVTLDKDLRVDSLVWTSDGKKLITHDDKHFLRVWDTTSGKKLAEAQLHPIKGNIALSPDDKWLAMPGNGWNAALVDVATLKIVKTLPDFEEEVRAVAFSPDGQWLAAGCHVYIRVAKVALMKDAK